MLGQGPDIFGHSPEFLVEAVTTGMKRGQVFAGQHELEIQVSEAVQETVPSAELVRFASSGTEVVQAALCVARAYTDRTRFIKFEGQYHGWMDSVSYSTTPEVEQVGPYEAAVAVPMSAGMTPGSRDGIIVLPWNDVDVLRRAMERHHRDLAAVITEPVMCNTNCIMPRTGYLEEMRRLCDRYGVVLIFDEVITGFRLGLGGAQQLLDVTPDLSTFAKAMAGGFPVSMLAGKRDMMGLIGDGTVLHGGTVNSNVMSMAAANAVLGKLKENDGAVHKLLYSTGVALMEGLREKADRHEVEMLIQGPGPMFCVAFTESTEITDFRSHKQNTDPSKYAAFTEGMLERGVRLMGRGIWFVSTAHTDEDVEQTIAAADETLASL